jgi:transcriptional regulator with XRE-family HTH domain
MLADIRLTYHIRRWRLRRHPRQAALGAQVGLSASTISAYEHGDVDIPISRLCRLAQALRVTLTDLVTWTEAPAPPGDQPSAATDGLRAPSRPGPRRPS